MITFHKYAVHCVFDDMLTIANAEMDFMATSKFLRPSAFRIMFGIFEAVNLSQGEALLR